MPALCQLKNPLPVYSINVLMEHVWERERENQILSKAVLFWNGWQLYVYIYIKNKVQSIHINALQNVKIHLTTQGIPETVAQTLLLNFTDMY